MGLPAFAPDERVSAVAKCISHIQESARENRQLTSFCHLLLVSMPTPGPVKAS